MSIYDAGFELADNADLYADGADVYITTGKEIDWVNSGLDIGQGTPIYLNITVGTTVYAGGTSVQFFLEVDDTSEGHDSTGKRVLMTDVILTVCAGTFTAGKVNAWLSNSPIGSTFNNQVAESNI
jgi:hypothetical protein